ncbi:hypothetical protein FRC12_005008 [Ceratobasidium sp. 428]|nr:hypothetical protein FRC12_005008 [Ceratobasidium sp. 428]
MTTEVQTKSVDRTKIPPLLLRTFVRSGGFHAETVFDEGRLPTLDEHAVHVWSDSTLHDVVRSLRAQAPSPSLPAGAFRNHGTKYSFRLVFFDRGIVTSRDLGHVGPSDLNDKAALNPSVVGQTPTPPTEPTELPADDTMDADDDAPRRDRIEPDSNEPNTNSSTRRSKSAPKTLDELRVQPGDWLSVSISLPASAKPTVGPSGLAIRGAEREREDADGDGHWRGGGSGGGRGRPAGLVRGGGHMAAGREREVGPGRDRDRDRPPPRDFSPPRRRDGPPGERRGGRGGGYGRRPSPDMTRGGTSYRPNQSRSRSRERRSRSPVGRRRNGRYDRD